MMRIRRMTVADAPLVSSMIRGEKTIEDFPGEFSIPVISRLLRRKIEEGVVAEIDGKPAGFMMYDVDRFRKVAYLAMVFVHKRFRNEGIASRFMALLLRRARNARCRRVDFLVRSWNRPMRSFAGRHGFKKAEDFVFFSRRLR